MIRILFICAILFTPIFANCDWNADGNVDVLDIVSMVDCIMNDCWDGTQCDWNEDGSIDILDVVASIDCIMADCWAPEIYGCTDPAATNYNPDATIDDGSCDYLFEWIIIPSGDYTYGQGDQIMTIDYDYEIMKYEVTNSQYRDYLNDALAAGELLTINNINVSGYYSGDENWPAGEYDFIYLESSACRISFGDGQFVVDVGWENMPVVEVSWFGSWAMGEFYGYRLPTEHEWEKAARSDTGWNYPWGDELPTCELANYLGCYGGLIEVGQTTGVSTYGVFDMAGNAEEWTDSYFNEQSSSRVGRGGSFIDLNGNIRCWSRAVNYPLSFNMDSGFRLAYTP